MKVQRLQDLFVKNKASELVWDGFCHDCKETVQVSATIRQGKIAVTGGAVYEVKVNKEDRLFLKCPNCFTGNRTLTNFRPTEIYSRIVGYMRPVGAWNGAKQAEFKMRKTVRPPAA